MPTHLGNWSLHNKLEDCSSLSSWSCYIRFEEWSLLSCCSHSSRLGFDCESSSRRRSEVYEELSHLRAYRKCSTKKQKDNRILGQRCRSELDHCMKDCLVGSSWFLSEQELTSCWFLWYLIEQWPWSIYRSPLLASLHLRVIEKAQLTHRTLRPTGCHTEPWREHLSDSTPPRLCVQIHIHKILHCSPNI